MLSELSDSELIKEVKKGHKASFEVLFERYGGQILNYVWRLTGNFQKAEDLTQETFLKVFRYIDNYKETGRFRAWLYTIAANVVRNDLRDRVSRYSVSLDAPLSAHNDATYADVIAGRGAGPDEEARTGELEKGIETALLKLKPKYRQILVLCDVQGLSYEEAAAICSCGIGTVGSRLSRARKQLAEMLDDFR